jgi:hypothetical protein
VTPEPARLAARPGGRGRWFQKFSLEDRPLTAAYWCSVCLYVLALWVGPFLPLIDYPQHVAVGALLRRMADPLAPERALYDVNLITYNGGFHVALAALSFLMRPEVAGRVLVSSYPLLLAYAALSLVRVAGRPLWYALLVLPITFSFAVGWGFANYFLSIPLVLLAFSYWLRGERGEPGMRARVMLISAVLAYTHVLATLCLCVTIGVAGFYAFCTSADAPVARLRRLFFQPLAVWPAVLWCSVVFVHNRNSPHANWEGWDDGLDDPLWYKLLHVTAYSVGNFSDHTDQLLFACAVALLIGLWQWPRSSERSLAQPCLRVLALTWAALYCVIPKVFIATWFIFERFPTFAWAFAVAAAPIPSERFRAQHAIRRAAAVVAVLAGANTVWHLCRIPGAADADAILDDIPAGKNVVAVTWSNTGDDVILREMWVHLLAYYQARRPGLIGYSFAKFESMPVHYALDHVPPGLPGGIEWDARKYDATQPYARFWNTVLVRTPDAAPQEDPRTRTFGRAADSVELLAHRGRFWLFDASHLGRPAAASNAPDPETPD